MAVTLRPVYCIIMQRPRRVKSNFISGAALQKPLAHYAHTPLRRISQLERKLRVMDAPRVLFSVTRFGRAVVATESASNYNSAPILVEFGQLLLVLLLLQNLPRWEAYLPTGRLYASL